MVPPPLVPVKLKLALVQLLLPVVFKEKTDALLTLTVEGPVNGELALVLSCNVDPPCTV